MKLVQEVSLANLVSQLIVFLFLYFLFFLHQDRSTEHCAEHNSET